MVESTENDIISEISTYYNSELKTCNDISYRWVKNDKNIAFLCNTVSLSLDTIDKAFSRFDFGCELKLLKLITEDPEHKSNLLEISKNYSKLNRYQDMIPCKYKY